MSGQSNRLSLRGVSVLAFVVTLILSSLSSCGPTAHVARTGEKVSSEIAGLSDRQRLRRNIPQAAERFLGARYAYGAKGPKEFDCSGFTSHVLREFDVALLGSSMSQAKQGYAVSPTEAQPGDIVYFATSSGRVNHVAVVVCNGAEGLEVVHATTSRGVVRDNISKSSYWAPRLAGARCVADCRIGVAAAY